MPTKGGPTRAALSGLDQITRFQTCPGVPWPRCRTGMKGAED